jgi:hypothetical protein
VPSEGSALLLCQPTGQFISRVKICPNDQHLLGQRSAFQPSRARRIQLWLTTEMATIALKQEVTVLALDPNAIRSASMNSTAREHENIEELGELSLVLMASASAFWGSRWDVL